LLRKLIYERNRVEVRHRFEIFLVWKCLTTNLLLMQNHREIKVTVFDVILILFFSFSFLFSNAQGEFQHIYGTNQADWCTDTHPTSDGGVIMAGMTYDTNLGWDTGPMLLKTDKNGVVVWKFCADSLSTTRYVAVVEDPSDNGFIAVTSSARHYKAATGSDANTWMFKVDKDGALVWSKFLSGDLNVTTKYDYFQSLKATSDGNFIAVGYTENTSFSVGHGSIDMLACKFNSAGTLLWTRALGTASYNYGYTVIQCSDGDYMFYGFGGGGLHLMKLSPDGNTVRWGGTGRSYSTGSFYIPGSFDTGWGSMNATNTALTETADGGYAFVGYFWTGSFGGDDFFVMKVNSAGTLQWANRYGETGNDRASGIVTLANGDLMVTGHTYSSAFSVTSSDAFLLRLNNTNGNIKWFYTYNSTGAGGSIKETAMGISLFNAATVLIAGGYDNNQGCGAMDAHMVKMDTSGVVSCSGTGNLVRADHTSSLLSASLGGSITTTSEGTALTVTPTVWPGGSYGPWDPVCDNEICLIAPLPIELLAFNGKKKGANIELEWVTASELNNDYFIIEKSLDGIEFEQVGTIVDGAGTSNNQRYYQLTDSEPYPGMNYYRLKQVDFDGSFAYSEIKAVNFNNALEGVYTYPNPSKGGFTLTLETMFDTKGSMVLIDAHGQQIENFQLKLERGTNQIRIDRDLPSGIYFLNILTQEGLQYSVKQIIEK
jgi:hypothetical protein